MLDVPVPKSLLAACPLKEDREFTRMRYTAATCDPDNFMEERYSLRQQLMSPPRQVELMIVMSASFICLLRRLELIMEVELTELVCSCASYV